MNKIEISASDETTLAFKYKNLVLENTRSKLAFVISVFARKQRKINKLEIIHPLFIFNRFTIKNDLNPGARKTLLNLIFNAKKKVEKADSIDYLKIDRKTSYKKSFSSFNIDLDALMLLYVNLENLITKRLTSPHITAVLAQLKGKLQSNEDQIVLNFVFDYPNYFHQTRTNSNFFGVQLAQSLSTNVCVYCNREYISTITNINGKKVISPAFDHFLSQSEYPYMAISLFNLIPSCYSCNSQLKHDKNFNLKDYLYPYEDSYEHKAEFKAYWKILDLSVEISKDELINVNDLEIKVEPKTYPADTKIFGDQTLPIIECHGNINVFQTELVYDSIHRDCVHEIICQFRIHSKKDIESLKTSYKFIKNDSEAYQFYFNNYMNEEDFNKRPLARLTRDIVNQLEDIYKVGFNTK